MSAEQTLYDGFIADYYDSSPMVTQRAQDVAFYCNAAQKYGDPLLELGCGTGRISFAIAEADYRVVGLDISTRMLERAEAKRQTLRRETRDPVRFIHGDMTSFDL